MAGPSVTEQDIAMFQEAFFTRPGDGSLSIEKISRIFESMDIKVPEKDIQVCGGGEQGDMMLWKVYQILMLSRNE